MPQLPYILFPTPQMAVRTKRQRPITPPHMPALTRQKERLTPIFQHIQNSFIQSTPVGIDPEQVLVIETIGNVEDFVRAVSKIEELEWMGEIEVEDIAPDTDFYDVKEKTKELTGRLYLILTNQQGLRRLLSIWQQYMSDPEEMDFKRGQYRGYAKFKEVFPHIKDIRRWSTKDRLEESKVFDYWVEDLKLDPNRRVRFETELWYRESDRKRAESEATVTAHIEQLGGSVISQCIIPSIAYHSILGEIPAQKAQDIINQPEVDLLKCDSIMFIRPTGQMITGKEPSTGDQISCESTAEDLPAGHPVIAVFDGMPLENHKLLAERLIIDDPDDWSSDYPAMDRQHGTAMTSLIIHGDLNDEEAPLGRPVYVVPIMKPVPWPTTPRPECIPTDQLLVDYIHKSVRRMLHSQTDQDATAPTVKIINLSIGDSTRHFLRFVSPFARLLDWLSIEYNILFIISAGNHPAPIETGMTTQQFESLTPDERKALIVKKLYEDARHRKLLSPAESINGLTVGSLHYDNSSPGYIGHLIDVFDSGLPSPVSAFGSGHRRSIKPDLVYSGGRVLYSKSFNSDQTRLQISNRNSAPGNQVAAPGGDAGILDRSQFSTGSSNSTALITRAAGISYDYLSSIFEEQAPEIDFDKYGVPLLKALIVHGCSWSKIGEELETILRTDGNSRDVRNWISRWIGYGAPDINKSLGCNEQRATILGHGELNDGEAHVYSLPLPPSLNARREWRRFTVTLAWFSPVASTTQRYRVAQLWFDFEDGKKSREKLNDKLRVTGIDSDNDATRRGTIQHEVFEGESAVAISDGDTLRIKVNCREDATKITAPVAYGLVISLEVAESIDLPIYNEIRTRIAPPVEIRPGG